MSVKLGMHVTIIIFVNTLKFGVSFKCKLFNWYCIFDYVLNVV